jgi:hypothetical protein
MITEEKSLIHVLFFRDLIMKISGHGPPVAGTPMGLARLQGRTKPVNNRHLSSSIPVGAGNNAESRITARKA